MEQIYHLLQELDIKRTYNGYYYLAAAIRLVIERDERLFSIHKLLYQEIAILYETTPFCVERNIRTVKNYCWSNGNRSKLERISGQYFEEIPSNLEFIRVLSSHIKKQSLSL